LIRCFIQGKKLYIDQEAGGIGVEIDNLPSLFDSIPTMRRWPCYADSARPETISYMKRNGFPNVKACDKWPGSVEDGLEYLRSFEKIIVHPRCRRVAEELSLYQYKVDRQTGDIQPVPVDANNHWIDALRYALGKYIKGRKPGRTSTSKTRSALGI